MKHWKIVSILAAAQLLTACGVEGDFEDALNDDKKYMPLCYSYSDLGLSYWSDRAEGTGYLAEKEYASSNLAKLKLIKQFKKAGYLSTSESKIVGQSMISAGSTAYKLTEKGADVIKKSEPICFGSREVSDITEYIEKDKNGGMGSAKVNFTYDVDFNDLVDDLDIEKDLEKALKNKEGKALLVETSNGWKVEAIGWK